MNSPGKKSHQCNVKRAVKPSFTAKMQCEKDSPVLRLATFPSAAPLRAALLIPVTAGDGPSELMCAEAASSGAGECGRPRRLAMWKGGANAFSLSST